MSWRLLTVLVLLSWPSLAQTPAYQPQYGKSGIDLGALDTNVDPCTNFYQFACGNWRAKNPIPSDQARWGRFNELAERNLVVEREILEKASKPTAGRSAVEQKIGDFYAACMDEKGIDSRGVDPVKPALESINALASKDQLAAELARLKLIGVTGVFGFYASPDLKDASVNIANIDQGGISLPDRDYYLKTDPRSVELRNQYQQHVANMFDLLAKSLNTTWDAKAKAGAVLKFETALAEASMDRVLRRNPESRNHPMTTGDLAGLTPDFRWNAFIADEHTPSFTKINVGNPEFFKKLDGHPRPDQHRRPEDVPGLEAAAERRERVAAAVRRGELPVLRQDPEWPAGIGAALETLCARHRPGPGRGARAEVRRSGVRRAGEGQGAPDWWTRSRNPCGRTSNPRPG